MSDELEYAILSVSGPDNVGVGAEASCFLLDHGANIVEEHGKVFNPDYAIECFHFEASPQSMKAIRRQKDSALAGLNATLTDTQKPLEDGYAPFIYVLEVVAVDRKGISATIEGRIADLGVNIRQVEGRLKRFAGTSETIYMGSFYVQIPPDSIQPMRDLVLDLVRENHWDIDLRPEKSWYGTTNMVPLFRQTMTAIHSIDSPSSR